MIKQLLIGASALALTTTVAHAQVDPRLANNQDAVNIVSQHNIPVQGGDYATLKGADDGISSLSGAAAAATAAKSAVEGGVSTTSPAAGGHAGLYIDVVANQPASGGIQSLFTSGDKAAIDTRGNNNNAVVDQTEGRAGWSAIDQTGSYNDAKIKQNDTWNGGASANMALIQQISRASGISSSNDANKALINQTFTAGPDGQMAAIIQGGINDGSTSGALAGGNNRARIDQRGRGDVAAYGIRNDALIVQGARASTSNQNNTGYIEQGNTLNGSTVSSHAVIQQRQNGDAGIYQNSQINSRAFVVQAQGTDTADVIQTNGERNFVSVYQDAESQLLTAFVKQENGSDNSAFVDQSGNVGTGYAEIFQNTGNGNVAVISQNGAGGFGNANGQINQVGSNNFGSIRQ